MAADTEFDHMQVYKLYFQRSRAPDIKCVLSTYLSCGRMDDRMNECTSVSDWMRDALKFSRSDFIFLYLKTDFGSLISTNILEPDLAIIFQGDGEDRLLANIPRTLSILFLLISSNRSFQMPGLSPETWPIPKRAEMSGGMILWQFSCPWGLLYQIKIT